MTYDDLIKHYGTEAEAARAITTDRQRVHGWGKRGRIPIEQQIEYEVATAGALKANIPLELRGAA